MGRPAAPGRARAAWRVTEMIYVATILCIPHANDDGRRDPSVGRGATRQDRQVVKRYQCICPRPVVQQAQVGMR